MIKKLFLALVSLLLLSSAAMASTDCLGVITVAMPTPGSSPALSLTLYTSFGNTISVGLLPGDPNIPGVTLLSLGSVTNFNTVSVRFAATAPANVLCTSGGYRSDVIGVTIYPNVGNGTAAAGG